MTDEELAVLIEGISEGLTNDELLKVACGMMVSRAMKLNAQDFGEFGIHINAAHEAVLETLIPVAIKHLLGGFNAK